MSKSKTLVTGGAGFIGSHVADRLAKQGHHVVVLDDLSGGRRGYVPHATEFVEGSVVDHALVNNLFDSYRFDYVFHLAAYAAEGLSHFIRRFNYENNLIGSMNIVNAAVNYQAKRLVFTSSIAVYGAGHSPLHEGMTPIPEDPYGIAKYAVEQDIHAASKLFGLPYTIFRPHNVYGERQNIGDRYRNVVGIFMNRIMNRQPLPVFGDGSQTRAFTYIDDVAHIIADCITLPAAENETFNIGADEPITVRALAERISQAMNTDLNLQLLPERFEVKHAFASHEKIKQLLNFSPRFALSEGIQRMAEYVLRHGPESGNIFENIEIEKGLPASWRNI